jgi:AraC-like DNA-binding protein
MTKDRNDVVPLGFVLDALDSVRAHQLPVEQILRAAGLSGVTDAPGVAANISVNQFARLWRSVSAAIDDEAFGLGARPMRPGSFDMMCHCAIHCGSLGKAVRRAIQFLNLILDDPTASLLTEGRTTRIILEDHRQPGSAFAYRSYWVMLHGMMCWLVGRNISLLQMDMAAAAPGPTSTFRTFFGAPVRFGQPIGQIVFDSRFLKLPIVRSSRSLGQFLRHAPENLLAGYYHDQAMADVLRQHLLAKPARDWPNFNELCRALAVPPRTLRRRLHLEGQSFHALKDEMRRDKAIELLLTTRTSIGEISIELGYREPSAFYRAFQNWMACSPGRYREMLAS